MSSNNAQKPDGLVIGFTIAVFVVAFLLFIVVADYRFFAAFFLAALIAVLSAIILYLAFGNPASQREPLPSPKGSSASGSGPESSSASASTGSASASSTRSPASSGATAATTASAGAGVAAARSSAADETAATTSARSAEEEAARAAAEAKAAAEKEAEAARKAAEAKAAAEAKTAAPTAASEANASMADSIPDYDGDGIKEGTNEGTRPSGLDGPRGGSADDLKQIKGIGPKLEKLCNSLGFWHFDQVAAWTADEVAWVDANLEGFRGRVTRDKWVQQAGVLASGGETEFSKRVEDGDVY